MMSVSNVSAGAAASGYYKAEGYYVAGSPEAEAAASWYGKAAEQLADLGQSEFSGRVDDQTFSAMLDGHAPPTAKDRDGTWQEGQTLGRVVDGERQHRPGIDLTFSASKSVSVMGLVAGDARVVAAHDEAVKATMAYVEEKFITTRREVNGEIQHVPGKMIAGLFRHDTSRALDPQLHTHAVIQNMVLGEDGKWTALSNEEIYRNKMLIGAIYRNELAQNLEAAGFTVDRTGKDGITEIRGVPREVMDGFSKRRQEIEAALEARGVEGTAVDSALAALATRRNKQQGVDRTELKEAWEKEAQGFGVTMEQLHGISREAGLRTVTRLPGVTRDGEVVTTREAKASALVDFAIDHVSERNAVYSADEIMRVALNRSRDAGIRDIDRSITQKEESGRLVPVHMHDWKETRPQDVRQPGEGFTGTLKEVGEAPYQNNPKAKESTFVTVETRYGAQTVWGVDLAPSLAKQNAVPGDVIHLRVESQSPVVVRNDAGKEVMAHRNNWSAEVVERGQNRTAPADKPVTLERQTVRLYTDDATLAHERMVIREFRSAKRDGGVDLPGRFRPTGSLKMSGEAILQQRLKESTLTEGQKDAVAIGLTGDGRFVGVQGYAGTGKTTMIETLRKHAERAGYTVEGAAPSLPATGELAKAIPGSSTVASLLLAAGRGEVTGKSETILVVDEAGMISTRDMRGLMEMANRAGYARVMLVGDVKQLDAVSAGSPFAQLQKAGMPTAVMTDIQRQRSEDAREAVLHAIRGEVKQAFARISDIRTPQASQSFPSAVADVWLDLHSSVRAQTGVIVLTNRVREQVNQQIRTALKDEHRIARQDTRQETLGALSLTTAERREAASFKQGDVILSLRKIEGLEVNRLYDVTGTNYRANTITVRPEGGGGAEIALKLGNGSKVPSALVAFERGERDYAAGDQVRFTITDRDSGVINGARGTIERMTHRGAMVAMKDGRTLSLSPDSLAARGMDHAYASTAHNYQGSTIDRVIVGMTAGEQLSTQKSFYVNISRARDAVTLITDKPGDLADRIEKNTGNRPAALDAYAQRLADERAQLAARQTEKQAPSPARDHADTTEILREQVDKLKASERPKERNDRELAETMKEIEQMQKVKEGPIR